MSVTAHATPPPHLADATNSEEVSAGKRIYQQRCAGCHGRQLQGQPLWQLQDQFARRRAPAHDASGHTWEHSDEELFHMTKYGRFSDTPPGVRSYMPAFAGSLDESQIVAVIAFIKARWPLGLRVSQSLLNPGYAGMPVNAQSVEWTFPPTCITSAQRWRAVSR
jgi:mono/diheme cytochrome c family protein